MTPLGRGLLTGMTEVDDPKIAKCMTGMLGAATTQELNQTVMDMTALTTALCAALGDLSDATAQEVLDCALEG
jgi:hypothetical protein